MKFHARLLKLGLDRDPKTATQLLHAYASSLLPPTSPVSITRQLFDQVPSQSRDPTLWMAVISSFARSHRPISIPSLHTLSLKLGFHSHVVVATSLLNLYAKSNSPISAHNLFDEMPQRSIITWNSMVAAYTTNGMGAPALKLIYQMKCVEFNLGVDEFTVSSGLTACAGLGDLRSGTQIHGYAVRGGFEVDHAVSSATANMYFRCGDVDCAERVIKGREESLMVKLMMINGYVFNEMYGDAIRCICRGTGSGSVEALVSDHSVVVSILTSCAGLGLRNFGRQVHGITVVLGRCDDAVLGCALIDMYCKCSGIREARAVFDALSERQVSHWNSMIAGCIHGGFLEEARGLFEDMPTKNVISWTGMISGYVQHGLPQEGLRLLARLYSEGGLVRRNCFTFASALNACSCLAALDVGKQVHAQTLRMIGEDGANHVVVATALVDMYSKSGSLGYARRVFNRMGNKNVVSWTSMITGYAAHGLGLEAIRILEKMMRMGFEPNEVSFLAILNACSHCGLVEQGMHYFNLMRERYGIAAKADHYTCLVDMLGRAGKLAEAWNLVEEVKDDANMVGGEDDSIWGALLAGCKLHGNIEIGSKVAKEMINRRKQTSDAYVALSNVYASDEKWGEVYRVRGEWKKQGIVKEPGVSHIHVGAVG